MFHRLEEIHARPEPFSVYSARELWTDEHTSQQMLAFHLNENLDLSSRRISFIDRSAKWIISRFDLQAGRSVVDFGCGPGLYAERFAATKASVTGIDFSKRSLEYARERAAERGLRIDYIHQDYLEFHSEEKFDLALMIFCDYCALSPAQRRMLLGTFRSVLKPNGSILLDVHSAKAFERCTERVMYAPNLLDHFWSPREYFGFLNTFKYDDAKVSLDKYTIIEEGCIRTIYNWLQYFEPASLAAEFAENGWDIENCLANVAGDEFDPDGDEFAVIAHARAGSSTNPALSIS